MQKLSDIMAQIVITNASDKDIYADLLSKSEVTTIFEQYDGQINLQKLPNFMSDIAEFVDGIRGCQNCPGLKSCNQPIRGHFPTLTPQAGNLTLQYAPCHFFKSQQHLANIDTLHMPKSMATASFETMHTDANREELFRLGMDFVVNYRQDEYKKGLFLYGSMGSGKTYAVCAIANELAKRGIGCAVVYFPELIAQIKEGFNANENNNVASVEKLKNVPVLMLDDIGSESVTSWMRDEILGRILNHRMNHELPTFFTSNFDFEQLQTHYAQTTRNEYEPVKAMRILERIKALSIPVELVGKNYRR